MIVVPSEDEALHDVFIPTHAVHERTTEQYPHFEFYPTLAYVGLKVTPVTDDWKRMNPEQLAEWRTQRSSILVNLFGWLKRTKKVKRIIKLEVEDDDELPHSESVIETCLKNLEDVRYLNWRRPNLSVQTLTRAKATNIVELWLYSTGFNAVLSSWADQSGLQTLNKVRRHLSK